MDWTDKKVAESTATLRKWRSLVEGIEPSNSVASTVVDALSDDLNTAGAIAALHALASAGDAAGLRASAELLGLLTDDLGGWARKNTIAGYHISSSAHISTATGNLLIALIKAYTKEHGDAKATKDFSKVDALRTGASTQGIKIVVGKNGVELELLKELSDNAHDELRAVLGTLK